MPPTITAKLFRRMTEPSTVALLRAAIALNTESAKFIDILKKRIFYGGIPDYMDALRANALEINALNEVVHKYLAKKQPPQRNEMGLCPAPISTRGTDWLKFSDKVFKAVGHSPQNYSPPANILFDRIRRRCEKGDFVRAAISVCQVSKEFLWESFSEKVLYHIENYTVPQYGDKGTDRADSYTVKICLEHVNRYMARYGRNSRPGHDKLDLLKMAHYILLASQCTRT